MSPAARDPEGEPQASLRVFVTHPGSSLYGSDRMVAEAVAGMVEAGWSPVVCVPETGPLTQLVGGWGVDVRTCRSSVLRKSALSPSGFMKLVSDTTAAFRQGWNLLSRERPDVVYVNTVITPLWLVLAKARRVPVLCHVHEAEDNAPLPVQRALALPLRLADGLVVNSHSARSALLRAAPHLRARSVVVLNGVQGPASAPASSAPVPGGPFRLLYMGRLSERKGVQVAIDALEILLAQGIEVHLDLVGSVYAEHTDFGAALSRRASDPRVAARLTFHGFQTDVWPHLAACDILVVPSILPESFGNTAVEGVLAGRPVIASDLPGLAEALHGYRSARLVPPGDARALADALRTACESLSPLTRLAMQDADEAARRHDPRSYRHGVRQRILDTVRIAQRRRGVARAREEPST